MPKNEVGDGKGLPRIKALGSEESREDSTVLLLRRIDELVLRC